MAARDALSPAQCQRFFAALKAQNPHPATELEYTSPFELLIAVILSAQATDVSVNRVTRRLFLLANTPEQIEALGEAQLQRLISTIGLFRSKARHVMATCRRLIDAHGSRVPRERAALQALPGVGRKTANVILNTIFGEPTIAVDTHLFRVANRTGLAPGKDPLAVERGLLAAVPAEYLLDAHHWLILHGRYTCRARLPECWRCPVYDVCRYQPKRPEPGTLSTPGVSHV